METSAQEVHENLNSIIDYQTHHRLRETQVKILRIQFIYYLSEKNLIYYSNFALQGRKRAEDLNERVMIWSFFVTVGMVIVGISQVCVLKSFFSEKKPSQMYGYHH